MPDETTAVQIGEFGLIRRLERIVREEGDRGRGVLLSIGDDTALLRPKRGYEQLVTCDCLVEGRHYLPDSTDPFALGRRAMVMNISDIGAMGGYPVHCLVSLGLRAETAVTEIESLYRGFLEELRPFGATIVGGNVTRVTSENFINITMFGEVEPDRVVRRSTARAGDAILVTGFPGEAAAGLALALNGSPVALAKGARDLLSDAYHAPVHRARLGRALALKCGITSMIDVSDGLLGDLGHLCDASGLAARVASEALPIRACLSEYARAVGKAPESFVLGASDDYELIFTAPTEEIEDIRAVAASIDGVTLTQVGCMVEGEPGVAVLEPDGSANCLDNPGWDHFSTALTEEG